MNLIQFLLNHIFEKKVGGYIQQDIQRKREVSIGNYDTAEWLEKCNGRTCFHCGMYLSKYFAKGNVIKY